MKVQFGEDGFNERTRRVFEEAASAFRAFGDVLRRIEQDHPEMHKHLMSVKSR